VEEGTCKACGKKFEAPNKKKLKKKMKKHAKKHHSGSEEE